jgi:sugar/nucleoside kinase (ribokinase family)
LTEFDVTVAGELNMDLILYGLPEVLPPERELLASEMIFTLGSSSAILAHNLSAIGNRIGFISRIGNDELGETALDRLRVAGVDVSRVTKADNKKTGLTLILPRAGWRNILTYPGTIFDLSVQHLDLEYLCSSRHFHLSSYYLQKGLRPDVPGLLREVKSKGLTVSLDCNDDPDDKWGQDILAALRYVDVFLPNAREAMKLTRSGDVETAVKRLADLVQVAVVKIGPQGARARRGPEECFSPAMKVDVLDTVGAGDSFDAGFIHAFIRGADLDTCLQSGNRAGAFSTTATGGTEAFRDARRVEEFFGKAEVSRR